MSNPPDCPECGEPMSPKNKNAAGHYRDKCWACILDEANVNPEDAKRQEPPDYD